MENKQAMSPEEAFERFKQAVLARTPWMKGWFEKKDAERKGK